MSRPTDWYVLDLSSDPVPGEPSTISDVARKWSSVADDADTARTQISSLLGDQAVMQWLGKAGEAFRSHSSKLPGQLQKCSESYHQAASALSTWSTQLEGHQGAADHALVLGRAALADLHNAQGTLSAAQGSATSAQSAVNANTATTRQAAHDTTVPPPDPAQVRAAVNRAAAASQAVASAQRAVGDAQARLDAAKRMAADAASLRDHDGHTTATRLHDAADAGISPDSFWHKLGDALGKAWHVLVQIAKVVVIIGGIIALIVGGPIAWIVFAAALIVLADTLAKYAQGKATLWDVALSALSCIPCTKGLTTLAELSDAFKAGGLLGAGSHLLASGKNAAVGFLRTAQRLRVGLAPATTAIITGLGDAVDAGRAGSGLQRITAFYGSLDGARGAAVSDAWASYVADVGRTDPARAAKLWQGHGPYPGVDDWKPDTLPPGTRLEAGWPGTSGFVVPDGTLNTVGHNAADLAQGTQVGPNAAFNPPYRSQAIGLRTTTHVDVASSTALANPQYGAGGLPQHFVPNLDAKIVSGDIQIVDASGHAVPIIVKPDGSWELAPGGSPTITMHGTSAVPGVPTIQHVGSTRPVIHQTLPRLGLVPWSVDSALSGGPR